MFLAGIGLPGIDARYAPHRVGARIPRYGPSHQRGWQKVSQGRVRASATWPCASFGIHVPIRRHCCAVLRETRALPWGWAWAFAGGVPVSAGMGARILGYGCGHPTSSVPRAGGMLGRIRVIGKPMPRDTLGYRAACPHASRGCERASPGCGHGYRGISARIPRHAVTDNVDAPTGPADAPTDTVGSPRGSRGMRSRIPWMPLRVPRMRPRIRGMRRPIPWIK